MRRIIVGVALVALAGGVAAALTVGRPEPLVARAAASAAEAAAAGLRYTIEGQATVELPEDAALPEQLDLDVDLDLDPERLCAQAAPEQVELCRQAVERLGTRGLVLRRQLEELRRRLAEQLRRFEPGRIELRFSGSGEAASAERTHTTLDWRTAAPVEASGTLEVITYDGRTFVRSDGGRWIELDGGGIAVGDVRLPVEASALIRDIDTDAAAEDLGTRTADGVELRGLRLVAADGADLEVWIDPDDRVRELHWTLERPVGEGRLEVRISLTITEVGVDVTVTPPADAVPLSEVPPEERPPFTVSVRVRG